MRLQDWLAHSAWTFLATVFLILGIVLFAREGILSPPAPEQSLTLVFIWWSSLCVGVIGLLLGVRDFWQLIRERAAARRLESFIDDPERDRVVDLLREPAPTAAGSIYRSIVGTREQGGWVDRTWLAWTIRSVRGELAVIGRTTRAVAGLLMILAVLGTFAGMRDAVPDLSLAIQNVTRSDMPADGSTADPSGSGQQVRDALDDVSAAFGANFLALFGAVVLGMASLGATTARAKLVRELALAAERLVVASGSGSASGADLADAIRAMTASSQSIHGMRDSIDRLNTMLRGFRADLRQSLEDLGSNVSRSIQVSLEEQMVETLDRTSRGVNDVATALAATTVAYEALIDDQTNSREALDRGVRALEKAADQATGVIQAELATLNTGVESVGDKVDRTGQKLSEGLDQMSAAVRGVERATEASRKSLSEGTRDLREAVKEVEDAAMSQADIVRKWTDATGAYGDKFEAACLALESAGKDTRDAAIKILDRLRQSELAAQGRAEELGIRIEERLAKTNAAIDRVRETLSESTSKSAEALADAANTLEVAAQTFSETMQRLESDRAQLLRQAPVRVELTPRSVEDLSKPRTGGLFRFFRRR